MGDILQRQTNAGVQNSDTPRTFKVIEKDAASSCLPVDSYGFLKHSQRDFYVFST